MDIKEFAERYKVNVRRDECNDAVVVGKRGSVYDGFSDGRLGVCVMSTTARKWNRVRQTMEAEGFTIKQNGDTEGGATFDPANSKQARLALKAAGIKTRRTASAAQLAVLEAARAQRSVALQSV